MSCFIKLAVIEIPPPSLTDVECWLTSLYSALRYGTAYRSEVLQTNHAIGRGSAKDNTKNIRTIFWPVLQTVV